MKDSKISQKKKNILMFTGLVLSLGLYAAGAYYQSMNEYEDDYSNTIPSNARVETLPDGRIKTTIDIEPPQKSNNIKTVQDTVNDYINSSPDKAKAIASMTAAYNIPAAENLAKISKLNAERAENEFKAAEWSAKTSKINEFGIESIQSSEKPKVDENTARMGYFKSNSQEDQATLRRVTKEIKLNDFSLLGIVRGNTAKLKRLEQEYSVKTGYVLHGNIKVDVSKNIVVLTKNGESINLYLD
jgi:hypothetical protein